MKPATDCSRRVRWDWGLCATLLPWLQAGTLSSKASELSDASATAASALDTGALTSTAPDLLDATGTAASTLDTAALTSTASDLLDAAASAASTLDAGALTSTASDLLDATVTAASTLDVDAGALSSTASDLLDATATAASTLEAEVGVVNMGSLLVGDIAMLVAAPLVVYAALKMVFWGSQEEAELAEEEPLDPLLSANVRSMVKAAPGQTSYVSQLKDPELQELASTAAQHISTTVRDAKETCTFQSSLHELAVKHGGAQQDFRWIEQVLKSGLPDAEDETGLEADRFAEQAGDVSNGELCQRMTRSIAQQITVQELNKLVEEVQKYKQRKAESRLFH